MNIHVLRECPMSIKWGLQGMVENLLSIVKVTNDAHFFFFQGWCDRQSFVVCRLRCFPAGKQLFLLGCCCSFRRDYTRECMQPSRPSHDALIRYSAHSIICWKWSTSGSDTPLRASEEREQQTTPQNASSTLTLRPTMINSVTSDVASLSIRIHKTIADVDLSQVGWKWTLHEQSY